jgi:hypothetical protein
MEINITTKFNVGDIVYVPDYYYHTYYASTRKRIINYINIYAADNLVVVYSVLDKDLNMISEYAERMLFATYEECQKWCAEQNC